MFTFPRISEVLHFMIMVPFTRAIACVLQLDISFLAFVYNYILSWMRALFIAKQDNTKPDKFGYKRLSGSRDIYWTMPRHTDRLTQIRRFQKTPVT